MTAIAGIVALDERPIPDSVVPQMVKQMAHRGTEPGHCWTLASAALGELSARPSGRDGHPGSNRLVLGRYAVVADVRIDNHDEIHRALGLEVTSSSQLRDHDLLALLYDKYGEGCASYIDGDFAFALWDTSTRFLFCARDRFGIKPFYYYQDRFCFAFASELKAFSVLPDVALEINEDRIIDYLVGDLQDQEKTFYQHCHRLKPAHTLKLDGPSRRLRSYWSLDPDRSITGRSLADCAAEFRWLFMDAVRCRLPVGQQAGAMLSGGLDSSSIVCAARQLWPSESPPLRTFSLVFDEWPQSDERRHIHHVLDGGGVISDFIHGDELAPLDDFDTVWRTHEEPFYAPNLFLHSALYRRAHDHGVVVLFDGLDGDLTVSHGIGYLLELARSGRMVALLHEIHHLAERWSKKRAGLFYRHVVRPMVPSWARSARRVLSRCVRGRGSHQYLLSEDLLNDSSIRERTAMPPMAYKTAREHHYRRLTDGFITFLMEVADRSARSCSIEPRYPFFDRRLVEFCLALPGQYKLRDGWTRFIMREAMEQILPPKVQWRPDKADLSPAFTNGLLWRNTAQVQELIHGDWSDVGRYLNRTYLADLYRRCRENRGTGDILTVWRGITLVSWLRNGRIRSTNTHEEMPLWKQMIPS
ncbi:MAG TPA: asparagine synthase-related protein [Nitrospiraceae bacterium]|nr:asparagine synthase-related protein [Nitrospiraceae bacterium]